MALEPEKQKPAEDATRQVDSPSGALSAPCATSLLQLQDLSQRDQHRLLTNLKGIRSAIETFGETVAATVIPTLQIAVQTPPGETTNASDSIRQAASNIASTVAELCETIDRFVRGGNEPLRAYRDSVETGTQEAIRFLREASPTSDDEVWRIKVHAATILIRDVISTDCEVITPNLILMIKELERLLGK